MLHEMPPHIILVQAAIGDEAVRRVHEQRMEESCNARCVHNTQDVAALHPLNISLTGKDMQRAT